MLMKSIVFNLNMLPQTLDITNFAVSLNSVTERLG